MKLILLFSTISLIHCRPQTTSKPETSGVEIEKQEVVEIHPDSRTLFDNVSEKKLADNTKVILEKIAEVNKKHGLSAKGLKADYVQVPSIYSRSQDVFKQQERSSSDFKFPDNPFINPIFEYLQNNGDQSRTNVVPQQTVQMPQAIPGYYISSTNPQAEVTAEDKIPGQYIKRKITHHQTFIVPSAQMFVPMPMPSYTQIPMHIQEDTNNNTQSNLESQTVENIKHIMNSQIPYQQQYQQIYPYGAVDPYSAFQRQQQIQWPFAQYFPIVIKDPFAQMMNAFTSMIEYGEQADVCSKKENRKSEENKPTRSGKLLNSPETKATLNYNIKNGNRPEITIFGVQNPNEPPKNELNSTELDIEDLQITNNEDNPMTMTFNFKADSFDWVNKDRIGKDKKEIKQIAIKTSSSRQSPPIRDQPLDAEDDEVDETALILNSEISKDDPKLQADQHKKLISKDNTGSGIFIHKLKVRKGGVAIAGPGGIATAGSGGTAIVGPNGFAYTHPDSLAIAGTGSKVIAVDPTISLSDIVNNKNKTRKDGSTPRVGKVVAVGPVIYYNKG